MAGKVVSKNSAMLKKYNLICIHATYCDIVRFRSVDDNRLKKLLGELVRWLSDIEISVLDRELVNVHCLLYAIDDEDSRCFQGLRSTNPEHGKAGIQLVVSVSDRQTINIWDVTRGHCLQTLEGHPNSINSVAFLSSSKLLAAALANRTIRIWDTTNGHCLHELQKRQRSQADNDRSRDYPEAEPHKGLVLFRPETLGELSTCGQSLSRYKCNLRIIMHCKILSG